MASSEFTSARSDSPSKRRAYGLLYLLQSAIHDWQQNEGNVTVYSVDALAAVIDEICASLLGDEDDRQPFNRD